MTSTNVRKLRRYLALAGIVIALPVCARGAVELWVTGKYLPQREFDPAAWAAVDLDAADPDRCTPRQRMIRDLAVRVLPGKGRRQIEELLGPSATHADMRRHTDADFLVREKDEQGRWKPYPRTGTGHYWDEFDWDLLYVIGREQIFFYDHKGQELSPDDEVLLIRLDPRGKFESWYIDGSTRWARVVGQEALATYRAAR